ncbi:MAG: LacI family DNA-binding transcriptional regulator [candidate division WOR-3 bacterium]|nr:LacI family transcriptional regulator [Candidatus Omnitrophota bacterium]MCM8807845.1 LacI family transcriptional regulator [Candidatus Omnitrophota bacterium]
MSDNRTKNKITIVEVAKKAGVSIKTVSRVINNMPYVSEETRKKVWKVIEELNYFPRIEGRQLAFLKRNNNLKTGNIGCLIFPTYNKYSEPFFAELLEEVDKVLLEFNLHKYFFHTLSELKDPSLFIKMINPNVIDGCVILGSGEKYREDIIRIYKRIKNVVILCDFIDCDEIACFYPDGIKGGYMATNYLISLGHRVIGCITGYLNWPEYSQLRLKGYKKALEDAGILFDVKLVEEGKYSIEGASQAVKKLIERNPEMTAIFVVSDPMAVGVYKGLAEIGKRIPDDISVIGFDNIKIGEHLHPSLTTISVDKYSLAKEGIKVLIDEINTGNKTGMKVAFPVTLVERDSVRKI